MMKEKSLLKNSFYNILYKAINIVFPLVTSAYVARVLMADSIGKVVAAQNVVSYFTLLAAMGIPTYGVKLIAQFRIKSKELDKAFSELFLINFVLSVVCSAAYYGLIFKVNYFDGKETLYAICGLNIVFNIFNVDWFYQGIQEYKYIAIRNFIFKCISLAVLMYFVKEPQDYMIYALISSGALVGNYIFNILRIRKYIAFTFKNICIREHIQHISILFVAAIAVEIYVLADITMLDILCNSAVVGYYTMSMRVIRVIRGLVVAVSSVFLPQLSYYYHNGKQIEFYALSNKGIHILAVLSVPAALGLSMVADEAVIFFFGTGFSNSIFITRLLAISIVTVALSNFIGMQILVTLGKEKITTISTICGAITNIVLNYFLIRAYGHIGAAIASVITEGVVTAIQLFMVRKYMIFEFGWKRVFPAAISLIVCVCGLKFLNVSVGLKLFLECGVGVFVYGTALIAVKDEFALNILQIIQRRKNEWTMIRRKK